MTYTVIATGSDGNAVLLNDHILIDCGVPLSLLRPYVKGLRLVLLTHRHSDHFNPRTVRALHRERPTLRFCCCDWMVKPLMDAGVSARVIDVVSIDAEGEVLSYEGLCTVWANKTHHDEDAPNCCWHIFLDGKAVFYATDTGHLDDVTAPDYDLYLLETNYAEAELAARIEAKEAAGEFCYERRAQKTHLSAEQAEAWLAENAAPWSIHEPLHMHVDKEAHNEAR